MTTDSSTRTVAPAAHGAAVLVKAGTTFSIVDIEGAQVGDLFAFNASDLTEFASASHTRSIIKKLFPRPGDTIYTQMRQPILTLDADDSPGRHDTQYAACDPRRYEMLGVTGPHRSCAMNLREALAEYGGLPVPTPQPFNVFMEVEVAPDGTFVANPATSKPGDSMTFTAQMDAIVVLSSCPMDVYDLSPGGITPLAIDVVGA
jgi:uncharacterized protein YcgI (DUF1989 family)